MGFFGGPISERGQPIGPALRGLPNVAGCMASHPPEPAYTFYPDRKIIDLDAMVAGLELT